jgi:hypothetical protein
MVEAKVSYHLPFNGTDEFIKLLFLWQNKMMCFIAFHFGCAPAMAAVIVLYYQTRYSLIDLI